MNIARAARKFHVPRYQIDYWRKTGLLSNRPAGLNFDDLRRLRFIVECKRKNLSLQKIRGYIYEAPGPEAEERESGGNGESPDRDRIRNLQVQETALVLLREDGSLLQPESGQLYFDYQADEEPGRIVQMSEAGADRLREAELRSLEERLADAPDASEVRKILKRILKLDPEHLGALIEWGNIAFENKDYDTAIEMYEKAVELSPTCVEAVYNLANLYFKQKKYAVAIRYYLMSIEYDSEFPESYYNLALVYYSLKYMDKALQLFEAYIRMDPDSVWRAQAEQFMDDIHQTMNIEPPPARPGQPMLFR